MYSKLTSIEGRAGRKADGRRGRAAGGDAALVNVSEDNLGAVIKILSRWEVNRKDFHKTPVRPSVLTNSGSSSSFLFFPCIFGWMEREYQKGLCSRKSWIQGLTQRDYTDLGGAGVFLGR